MEFMKKENKVEEKALSTIDLGYAKGEQKNISIEDTLVLLIRSFEKVLYDEDEVFLKNMKNNNLAGDPLSKYRYWEWTQGVGLYGLWKIYEEIDDSAIWSMLTRYYEQQLATGLPSKNINTTAPLLTLSYIYEKTCNEKYGAVCREWAEWLMKDLPRTKEGGFQHLTSDTLNNEELWDDTLFMAVLFLARMGKLLDNDTYKEEAVYQFLLHVKYLTDKKTGLWFHGWTFDGNHNFSEALWARGNSWATIAIPELTDILDLNADTKRFLTEALKRQVKTLKEYQHPSGMWHTLLDDPSSYLEASATCGFGYGMLRAVNMGLIDVKYKDCAMKAITPILRCISKDGVVNQVSYGTAMGRESKQFYKEIEIKAMPYGQALAMLFLFETYKTCNKEMHILHHLNIF